MPRGESGIIEEYFKDLTGSRSDVALGIGDDAALLVPPEGCELVASTDSLVEGVHFGKWASAFDIGWKALAVNLSDLAAMAAEPRWVLLALTLPEPDPAWLQPFSRGFGELARLFNVQLAGGNLTRGPLNVTVQVLGTVPAGTALRRDGAKAGDRVFVTGTLGGAAHALALLNAGKAGIPAGEMQRLLRPVPRVNLGRQLHGLSKCAIDLSDGLASDLRRVLDASNVGAEIDLGRLPLSPSLREGVKDEEAWRLALAGGDDYELCFTADASAAAKVEALRDETGCAPACIGRIVQQPGLRWLKGDGSELKADWAGYDHF